MILYSNACKYAIVCKILEKSMQIRLLYNFGMLDFVPFFYVYLSNFVEESSI